MEYSLGSVSQIPLGEGRNFVVSGVEIAVFHTRKGVYATQAECPHRRGPLADGLIGGTTVVCPFHAWKFDLATGAVLMGQCALQTYPLTVSDAGEMRLTFEGDGPLLCEEPQTEEIGVSQAEVGSAAGPALVA